MFEKENDFNKRETILLLNIHNYKKNVNEKVSIEIETNKN